MGLTGIFLAAGSYSRLVLLVYDFVPPQFPFVPVQACYTGHVIETIIRKYFPLLGRGLFTDVFPYPGSSKRSVGGPDKNNTDEMSAMTSWTRRLQSLGIRHAPVYSVDGFEIQKLIPSAEDSPQVWGACARLCYRIRGVVVAARKLHEWLAMFCANVSLRAFSLLTH